jgi:hypothetical protein
VERIFVNYRHGDSPGHAGRLYDHLVSHFGEKTVFRDIETIQFGADFVVSIENAISKCGALLVVIGPHWLDSRDNQGQRRLDDPKDFVRLEIVSALRRGIRTIPILVGDAIMPSEEELPPDLAPLARRRAIELSDLRFPADVDQLIHFLEEEAGIRPRSVETALPPHPERIAEPPVAAPAPALPAQEGPKPRFQDQRTQRAHPVSRRALIGMSALLVIAVVWGGLVFLNDRGKTPLEPTSPPSEKHPSQEPARAESNPSCGSVTQIGTTEYIKVGGTTFGSVKQFKGCGKNWGYVYVWGSWREANKDWKACAEVLVQVSAGPGEPHYDPRGTKCASNQVEVWSAGTATLQNCTRAAGYPQGAKELSAATSPRC